MPPRRRIPRLIANPLTSVLLAGALFADVACLDPWPESTCGRWYQQYVHGIMLGSNCMMPMRTTAIVYKEGDRMWLVSGESPAFWQEQSRIMRTRPPNASMVSAPQVGWSDKGFWAITSRTREFTIAVQNGAGFSKADVLEARRLFVTEVAGGPPLVVPPDYRERLQREDFTASEIVWAGYFHNALSLCGAGLLRLSLEWVRHIAAYGRSRRRRERGLCVGCAYPIAGLNRCPECGAPVPPVTAMALQPI